MKTHYPDIIDLVKQQLYAPLNLSLSHLSINKESTEYGACSFQLDGKKIEHRLSKITPTKVGQFVTIWKRNGEGITCPMEVGDDFDFIAVTARTDDRLGQFLFPKAVLVAQQVITAGGREGKRGIRVYPPWDVPASKQAAQTQAWQVKYFGEAATAVRDLLLR